jgi:hypothetical protein
MGIKSFVRKIVGAEIITKYVPVIIKICAVCNGHTDFHSAMINFTLQDAQVYFGKRCDCEKGKFVKIDTIFSDPCYRAILGGELEAENKELKEKIKFLREKMKFLREIGLRNEH